MFNKQKQSDIYINNNMFNIFFILIFGLMPLIITPWRNEIFYDGKILFTGIITLYFAIKFDLSAYIAKSKSNIDILVGMMLVLSLLSTIFSADMNLSLFGDQKCREGLISILLHFIIFYICYKKFSNSPLALEIIFIIASLISIYGILSFFNIVPGIENLTLNYYRGELTTIGNRNFVGTYCILLIPLCLGYYLKYRYKRTYIYIGLLFALLLACMTRGAWVAVIPSLLMFFGVLIKRTAYLKSAICYFSVLIIMFLFIYGVMNHINNNNLNQRFGSIITDIRNYKSEASGSHRILYWKKSFQYIFEFPILGSGPDTYAKVLKQKTGLDTSLYPKANNEYLQLALTMGFPYLLAYLLLVSIISAKLIKKAVNKGELIALSVFCCIAGYMIQAFFNISEISTSPIYWGLLGIGARIGEEAEYIDIKLRASALFRN